MWSRSSFECHGGCSEYSTRLMVALNYSILPQQTKVSGVRSSSVRAGLDDGDVVKVEFGVSW